MRIGKKPPIEQCCALPSDSRTHLQHVFMDVENSCLIAANGTIIAVQPAKTETGDTSGYVSVSTLMAARKYGRITVYPTKFGEFLQYQDKTRGVDKRDYRPTTKSSGEFPPREPWMFPSKPKGKPLMSIDAAMLLRLAQALNGNSKPKIVHIWEHPSGQKDMPFYVTGNGRGGGYGFIAPCR